MPRRIMVTVIAACCLTATLACGAGAGALQRGLIRPPQFSAQVGRVQVTSFTEVISSNVHPTHAYFTIWVFVRPSPRAHAGTARAQEWGRQIVRLEVADPTPQYRLGNQQR
jgi:hypothetical protein